MHYSGVMIMRGWCRPLFVAFSALTLWLLTPFPLVHAAEGVTSGAQERVIGVLALRGKDRTVADWQPTANYLSQALPGIQFRILPLQLDEIEDAVAQRRVDFVLTNPENYIVLEARHGISRNATLIQGDKNKALKEFGGLIFTRNNLNDINTLSDIKGRRVAAVGKNAFGAYQMQLYELLKADIDADDFTPNFVGLPQDNVVEAVARGAADVGFVRSGTLESMAAAGKIHMGDFRAIAPRKYANYPYLTSTALYPEWAFAALPHVEESLANQVTVSLLSLPVGSDIAKAGGYYGWAVPLGYNTVHDMMKALRSPPYDVEQNISLAELARKYDRHIGVFLLTALILLTFLMRRFSHLNHALTGQMTLVKEQNDHLNREVLARQRAERMIRNENQVLEQLAEDAPLDGILQTIAQMCHAEFAGSTLALFRREHGEVLLVASAGMSAKQRAHIESSPLPENAEALVARIDEQGVPIHVPLFAAREQPEGCIVLMPAAKSAQDEIRPTVEIFASLASMALARRKSSELMRLSASVFENALEGIVITNAQGRIIDISPSFIRITGYTREEAIGNTMALMRSGRHDEAFYRELWRHLLEHGSWSGEIWNRTKDGRTLAEILHIASVRDSQGNLSHYVGTFSDITSIKDAQHHLEKLASFDTLTGLPNRGLLADRLNQALSQAERRSRLLAICFLDLDGFKAVNDKHGHEAGDILLREVAKRLNNCVRAGDTVARLGGDEFVVLLGDIKDVDELDTTVARMLQVVSSPYDLGDSTANVSTSIGITLYPLDDTDPETLLRHADQAMYRAKQDGRNCSRMFDTEHAALHQERIEQRERLRQAINRNELVLYYQPRLNLQTGVVEGVEALLRWQDPSRGLLAPGVFLPEVERDDLICVIGRWVLHEALAEQQRWLAQGITLAVSVNIAARQFLDPRFLENLEKALAAFPQRPVDGLELEILESAAIDDTGRMLEVIRHCNGLGVKFALDDFGTGYSSLTYLQRFPADTLKIDRSFVNGMQGSRAGLAIVEAIIGLAGAFSCDLVAEGIETIEQGELLVRLGCRSGQGYFIAKPMPSDKLLTWMEDYRAPTRWTDWHDVSIGPQDFPLVLAEFEHRCWVGDLVAAAEGALLKTASEAILDPTQCEFGRWFESRGRSVYGKTQAFADIDVIHREIHHLGREIFVAINQGKLPEARERVPQLETLSERLILAIVSLQRGAANQQRAD